MELARGSLSEQPWGLTLGVLARRAATGELTIVDGAMRIVLAFDAGRLVAAASTMRAASLLERAARTFELTRGNYTIGDQITLRPERGATVDLRAVVFAGARKYLPDDRLGMELRELGSRYMLASAPPEEIARYGFEGALRIIDALREGATLTDLEIRHHDVDGREIRAAVYALVCCGAARGLLPGRAPTAPGTGRTPTPPGAGRTPTPPGTSRTTTPLTDRTPTRPDKPRPPEPGRTITPDSAARTENVALARIPTVNVARSKTPPDPGRAALQLDAATVRDAKKVVAGRVTPAGGVAIIGGAPPRITPAGGVAIVPAARAEAEAAAQRARAHLAANQVELAMHEASAAMRLAPDSFDHQALHAWATFLASRDRPAAADAARKALEKASHRANAPNEARFLLGRLERMVGREREALRHLKTVLEREPGHAAAAAELRELEAELDRFARR